MRLAAACLLACAVASIHCGGTVPSPSASTKPATSDALDELDLDVACVPTAMEVCADSVDNNCNGAIDEGCGVHTDVVHVALAWSEPDADLDLVVTDPMGQPVQVLEPTDLGLVKDRDCPGERDRCRAPNSESVYLVRQQIPRGTLQVHVRLTRLGASAQPVRARISARLGQRSYSATIELHAVGDEHRLALRM